MIVDAAVHPLISTEEYLRRLPAPWKHHVMGLPGPLGRLYESPIDEIDDLAAASDPAATAERLFADGTLDAAVLTPLTRGILPNRLHASAVASVTNDWLREVWLDHPACRRCYGSIRVAVNDPEGAVREIERWAGDPRFVQIAVPLRAWAHYGDDQYLPIWEAAVAAGLPVYVQDDLANAAELWHSAVGQPIHFAEADAMRAMGSIVHLASVLGSGLYDRLPELRFVFGDGGLDLAPTVLWRLNNDWRSGRVEIPWIDDFPSAIAPRFARFVTARTDGRPGGDVMPELAKVTDAGALAIYGSHRPYWDGIDPEHAVAGRPADAHDRILGGNLLAVAPRLRQALASEAVTR